MRGPCGDGRPAASATALRTASVSAEPGLGRRLRPEAPRRAPARRTPRASGPVSAPRAPGPGKPGRNPGQEGASGRGARRASRRLAPDQKEDLRDVRQVLRHRDQKRLRGGFLLVRTGLPARRSADALRGRRPDGGDSTGAGEAGGERSRTAIPSWSRYAPRRVQPSGKDFRRPGARGPSITAAASARSCAASSAEAGISRTSA